MHWCYLQVISWNDVIYRSFHGMMLFTGNFMHWCFFQVISWNDVIYRSFHGMMLFAGRFIE